MLLCSVNPFDVLDKPKVPCSIDGACPGGLSCTSYSWRLCFFFFFLLRFKWLVASPTT
jgi:hypothetical protein